jgi:hypothetical protein
LLRAAIDTEIKIERQDGEGAAAQVTKQRDLECGLPMAFKLRTMELGKNARGKAITSCVVDPVAARGAVLSEAEQEAKEILENLVFDSPGMTVQIGAWRKAIMSNEKIMSGQSGQDKTARYKRWHRLRDDLKKHGIVEIYGKNVRLRK